MPGQVNLGPSPARDRLPLSSPTLTEIILAGSYTFVPETKVRISVAQNLNVILSIFFSQENLDWAELVTLDLSKYGTTEGKQELAQFLIKALREKGFFYVKNFHISQEAVNRQFAIGRELYELPLEEKLKFVPAGLGACSLRSLYHQL